MKCPECSSENREEAKFCNECGHKLDLVCPKCKNFNRPESKFCDECGHDLSKPLTVTKSPESPESFQVLTETDESSPLPKGERRQATIVFSDLSGYTAMNEQLDPEEVEGIMSRIKEEAVSIVESYGGIVNQFVGDEILALFGIPTAHEDDPLRAVKFAFELHEMVRMMSPKIEDRIGKPLTMHTGINTGLIVTNLRDDRDGLYGITGETVNTGARLKSQAGSDEIIVSSNTQKLIAPYFEMVKLEKIRMKGKTETTIPFRVIEESKIHSRIEAAEQKGFTTYTGRDQELATLHTCLEKVVQGQGQFATVVGEAGVGKSRLHYEFRHSLDREKITVLQGRCQSYGSDIPYLPFVDAIRRGLHLRDEYSPAELLEKAVTNIKAIDPSLEQYIPLYLHLLSIRSDYPLPAHLQGKELRKAMEEALALMITLNTQHEPMVMILEDWHWSDEASQAALKHLLDVTAPYALMVVVTYRPDYSGSWGYLSYHTPVVLKPLDATHTEDILKSVSGAVQLPEGLGKLIHERTSGNPLFIEEVCYSLIEEGAVVIKEGQVTLTQSLEKLSLPNTVQAIIRTRLDRLDSNTKEAVRLASVIGRVFGLRILERIYLAQAELSESLEVLKALEVIQQIRVLPEAEYTFRHVLTQEVAYETVLLQRREELHSAIGRVIEELYSERLEEQATILVYHYARSERQDKATEYALIAGDQAASLYANTEATTYYEQALTMAQNLPSSPKVQQWQIDASLKLAAVGITRQDIERDRTNLEQACTMAEALNDESRLAQVLYWLGRIHYVLWSPQIAMEYAKQSLMIADRLGDDALAASPVNLMGRVYYQLSDFVQAIQFLERSVEQMRRIGNKVEESTASALAGYVLAFLGEFERAFVHADHAIQLAQEIQNPFTKANAYHLRGCIADQQGDWPQAIKDYEKAIHIAEKAEDLFRLYLVKSWKGRARAMIGDPDRGRELLEESLALAEKIGTQFWLAWQKTSLAGCLFILGELETGSQLCQEAILLGEETNDKYVIAFANRTFAEIFSHLEPSDPEKADRAILEAIRIQHEIDVKPEMARSYVSYAHLLTNMGEQEKAKEYIVKTIGMFKKMGMVWDLNQAEQLLRNLNLK
ncbi:MAG: AAA family ATPase [Desulfobacterales bacterium]|nr:MAG: AAA family ATPase [Desulfobacterales bacterium]